MTQLRVYEYIIKYFLIILGKFVLFLIHHWIKILKYLFFIKFVPYDTGTFMSISSK